MTVSTSKSAGPFFGSPFAYPLLLAFILLGEAAVFYAFCLRHRRRYR